MGTVKHQGKERVVKRITSGRRKGRARKAVRMSPELREYIRKTDRYRAGRDPIALLKTGPSKIARAVVGLNKRQLRKRPARGKWSIIEIVGHLVDTEFTYGYRNRLSLAQSGSQILGYDQAVWVDEFRYRNCDPKPMLEQIQVMRRATLDLVTRFPRKAWRRYGMHSERGRQTVQRNLELIAGHDLNHLDQILAIRRKYGW
jgi:DinB superfamily